MLVLVVSWEWKTFKNILICLKRFSVWIWFKDLFGILMNFCGFEVRILLIYLENPWIIHNLKILKILPKEVHFWEFFKNKNIAQLHINLLELTIYTQKQSVLMLFPFLHRHHDSLLKKNTQKISSLWRKVFFCFCFIFAATTTTTNDTMWSINIQYKWLT